MVLARRAQNIEPIRHGSRKTKRKGASQRWDEARAREEYLLGCCWPQMPKRGAAKSQVHHRERA
jgi:hypothetical protein